MTAANAPFQTSVENERRAHEPSMEEILASIRKIIADDEALPLSRNAGPPRLFETNVTPLSVAPAPSRAVQGPAESNVEPSVVAEAAHADVSATEVLAHAQLDERELASFEEVRRELSRVDEAPAPEAAAASIESAPLESTHIETAPAEIAPLVDSHDARDILSLRPAMDMPAAIEPETAEPHEEFVAPEPTYVESQAATGFDPPAMLSPEANASVASAFQALSASVQIASAETIDRHVREMLRPMLKQWLDDNLPVMVERLVRAEIERVARGGR